LEVCSPGLERELSEPWHFERYIGKAVKVKLIRPRDNKKEFLGILTAYDGGVTINDGEAELRFEKNEIVNVRLDDADI
jgi:ribosome maturation factor RimP